MRRFECARLFMIWKTSAAFSVCVLCIGTESTRVGTNKLVFLISIVMYYGTDRVHVKVVDPYVCRDW